MLLLCLDCRDEGCLAHTSALACSPLQPCPSIGCTPHPINCHCCMKPCEDPTAAGGPLPII
jgi:hypothetical protein